MAYMLGTMVTPNRDRARVYGTLIHFVNGWLFSLIYVSAFEQLGRATWWFGGLTGLVHGLFVITVVLPLLPAMHPRMASPLRGPTVVRYLEPPGFFGLNYGTRTPLMSESISRKLSGVPMPPRISPPVQP